MLKYEVLKLKRKVKMIKPNFLKTSHLRAKITNCIFQTWFNYYRVNHKPKNNKKILIISLEALGDNIIKMTSFKKLSEVYGKENMYIMCRNEWTSIYEAFGYNTVGIKKIKSPLKNAKEKINLFKKINQLGIERTILFEHIGIGDIQKYVLDGDKIGLCRDEDNPHLDKIVKIDDNKTYVLDRQIALMEELLNEKFKREDLRPDIREYFTQKKYSDVISIGIGASHEKKILPESGIISILKMLLKKYPNKKLILLGSGKKQDIYANSLVKEMKEERVENFVGKTSLLETMQVINDSDFFLGYDSGLSNIAFSLRKKYVCLFWTKLNIWKHSFDDLRIILGNEKDPINDGYHGTDILNSITLKQIEKALKELEL
ncbi:MAG: glycosyltransferase family 9 protein [Cetobacterium sp.]